MQDIRFAFPADDSKRKVIFLDIDGVMQPTNQHTHGKRFQLGHEVLEHYPYTIAELTGITRLQHLDKFDVAAVYLDWEPEAVSNLKKILNTQPGKIEIVLSSGWRDTRSFEDMKALFAIHELDKYLTEMCPVEDFCSKKRAIELYLNEHPLLENYVVLDDEYLGQYFPGRTVWCDDGWLTDNILRKVLRIFQNEPWWAHLDNTGVTHYSGYEKVVFCDEAVLPSYAYNGEPIEAPKRISGLTDILCKTKAEIVYTGAMRAEFCRLSDMAFYERMRYVDEQPYLSNFLYKWLDIADITPQIGDGREKKTEIELWIRQHPSVNKYVIYSNINDEEYWGPLWEHVIIPPVHTDGMGRWEWSDLYSEYMDNLFDLL